MNRIAIHLLTASALLLLSACATFGSPEETADVPSDGVEVAASHGDAAPLGADRDINRTAEVTELPLADTAVAQVGGLTTQQYPDLFDRIRAGFQLGDPERHTVDVQAQWFARNPDYLERVFGRSALYLHHIVDEIERRGMPLEIALLPVVESAFEPFAYSGARASGLWQFIPGTGNRFGLEQNWWYDGRRDVLASTRAALDYLQFMHAEFDGDWLLAIAGYNCGEGCVARAVRANRNAGKPIDFWSLRLPSETRAYVPKLLAMKRLVAGPERYGLAFSPIANQPYFARVEAGSQIDLKLAAELAGLSHDELFELNPAFHRFATPPQGPHALLLPIENSDLFRQNVTQLTPDELMRVVHHVVESGDTLTSLATRYNTQPTVLRALNSLQADALPTGLDLRVPSGVTALPEKVARAAARVDNGSASRARNSRRPSVHVVRRGESLWRIARKNNTDVNTLMRLNGMQPGQTLRAGTRIVVNPSAAPNRRTASAANSLGSVRYTVRSGDTLSAIARRHGVSVSQLVAWNGISARSTLRPGQKLSINPTQKR